MGDLNGMQDLGEMWAMSMAMAMAVVVVVVVVVVAVETVETVDLEVFQDPGPGIPTFLPPQHQPLPEQFVPQQPS
jgi:hypothetical protein